MCDLDLYAFCVWTRIQKESNVGETFSDFHIKSQMGMCILH